jgi:hypothetical protein
LERLEQRVVRLEKSMGTLPAAQRAGEIHTNIVDAKPKKFRVEPPKKGAAAPPPKKEATRTEKLMANVEKRERPEGKPTKASLGALSQPRKSKQAEKGGGATGKQAKTKQPKPPTSTPSKKSGGRDRGGGAGGGKSKP